MCGGSAPVDNSVELARLEAAEAEKARQAAAAEKAATRKRFEDRLNAAYGSSINSARDFFTSQGLNPDDYADKIASAAMDAKAFVPDLDTSPATYFADLGQSVFNRAQDGQRAKAQRDFDTFAREGFANRRITNDIDDPFLETILQDSRGDADAYLDNLAKRGLITNAGLAAGQRDLDKQGATARNTLNQLGLATLEEGRGRLRDIAAEGRTAAANSRLGDGFNAFDFQSQIDQSANDFFANLADSLTAAAPSDLFDTSGLAGIAGAAQGAQNTPFDPGALAGTNPNDPFTDEEDDEDKKATNPFNAF